MADTKRTGAQSGSLKGITKEDWRSHVVEFRYRGKDYRAPIEDNLVLKDLSVDEVKKHLNEIPGRLSYWKSFQVTLEREIADQEEEYEIWYQTQYMAISLDNDKKTEGWKKSKVLLDNTKEYRVRKAALRDMHDINSKVNVLVTGYNTMTWTLREIARLTVAELSNIEIRGKGTLSGM